MKFGLFLLTLPVAMAMAQTPPSPQPVAQTTPSAASSQQVNGLLSQVEKNSQNIQANLSAMRVDKWKTDGNTRRSTQADIESLQRNLHDALPEIMGQLRNAPDSLPATFKLYRNLDALYDVFSSVTESTGAFGPKDDYQALANDLNELERNRKSLAERMDTLSASKEGQIAALQVQLHEAQAAALAAAAPPAQKKVVDDTAPPPQKTAKKKPKVPKPPSANQTQGSSSQTSTQSTPSQQQQTQSH